MVRVADGPITRAVGLLGRSGMEPGEGLWIVPCPMIHTWFMRFSIDVLFLDRGLKVLKVLEDFRPWRLSPLVPSGHSVLELPAGALKGSVREGDLLEIR